MNKIIFKRTLSKIGGSTGITIPTELQEYLQLKQTGQQIHLIADKGKHGKYIAIYNPKQEKKE